MAEKSYLAVDMGASSGRSVLGHFDGRSLRLEEIYRFENGPVQIADSIHWDLLSQWSHICQGLRAAAKKTAGKIVSVGVDTWGVDFGLLGRNDELLGNPYHYRDDRTNGILEKAFAIVPRQDIFRHTALQFMQINTLYQLLAMKNVASPLLDAAQTLLMMPDLFHWLLTGIKCNEMTIASTSQCYNPLKADWAFDLLEKFNLPAKIFGPIAQPGTVLGPLRKNIAAETGLHATQVVLPGSHDTASAVMAVPSDSQTSIYPIWCYISLGTWALLGIESPQPIVTDEVLDLNFTNEGGVGATTRLLKNITGLWLAQECRRIWNQSGEILSWEDLNRLVSSSPPFCCFVDPDASDFLAPGDMPQAIRTYCHRTNQPVPDEKGKILRCILESLALKFRCILGLCEQLSGSCIETIHIVGGGVKNRWLCQAVADACARRVVAGPVEATATGNVMMQAIAAGDVASIAQAREIIRRSFDVEQYEPKNVEPWNEAYQRFLKVIG